MILFSLTGWLCRTTSADLGSHANGLRSTELVLDLAGWRPEGETEREEGGGRAGAGEATSHPGRAFSDRADRGAQVRARHNPANQTIAR